MALPEPENIRFDLQVIASLIEPGSRVLDLGCGSGELLAWLAAAREVRGAGIEQDKDKAARCIARIRSRWPIYFNLSRMENTTIIFMPDMPPENASIRSPRSHCGSRGSQPPSARVRAPASPAAHRAQRSPSAPRSRRTAITTC